LAAFATHLVNFYFGHKTPPSLRRGLTLRRTVATIFIITFWRAQSRCFARANIFANIYYMEEIDKTKPLCIAAAALLDGEANLVANMANLSALIFERTANINWAGFYIFSPEDKQLVLGPFQGKVACVRIPIGKGVCGAAAQKKEILIVPDIRKFPGHIACDSASNSEIVVPIIKPDGNLFGVLDIDSPLKNRFTAQDKAVFEEIVNIFAKACKF
jgi:GAF domain-containing protein